MNQPKNHPPNASLQPSKSLQGDQQEMASIPKTVVMKLGGTSVAHPGTLEVMDQFLPRESDGTCILVLSALAGTTDLLVKICDLLHHCDVASVGKAQKSIEAIHIRFLEAMNLPEPSQGFQAIWQIFEWRIQFQLENLPTPPTPAQADEILAFGERFSTEIYAPLLKARNDDVCLVPAGDWMVTDRQFGQAKPLKRESLTKIHRHLDPLLKPGRVILTQGFTGVTRTGETTTLGRGGSDFSATFLAAQLGAQRAVIWTDTPGILSADPRQVPSPRTLSFLTYEQAEALACNGAKILHFRSIEPLTTDRIPLEIRSTFQPQGPASLIGASSTFKTPTFSLSLKPAIHPGETGEEAYPSRHLLDVPFMGGHEFQHPCYAPRERTGQVEEAFTYRQWVAHLPSKVAPGAKPEFVNVCLFFQNLKESPDLCRNAMLVLKQNRVHTYFFAASESGDCALFVVAYHQGDQAIELLHEYLAQILFRPELIARGVSPALVVEEQCPANKPFPLQPAI